jgi:P-aminobenzoate N-oxygenase AurF
VRLDTLVALSKEADRAERYAFDWPATLPADNLWMSRDLLSVTGTEVEHGLSRDSLLRLCEYECLNFFSLNVHGIRDLLRGVLVWSHHPSMECYSAFLEHFLIEETQHLRFFAEFCRRYWRRTYPARNIEFPDHAGPAERRFVTFAGILIFEETGHFYNRRMMTDPDLPPIIRAVNGAHYDDEGRHIAAGLQMVSDLYDAAAQSAVEEDLARLHAKVRNLYLLNRFFEEVAQDSKALASVGYRSPACAPLAGTPV